MELIANILELAQYLINQFTVLLQLLILQRG